MLWVTPGCRPTISGHLRWERTAIIYRMTLRHDYNTILWPLVVRTVVYAPPRISGWWEIKPGLPYWLWLIVLPFCNTALLDFSENRTETALLILCSMINRRIKKKQETVTSLNSGYLLRWIGKYLFPNVFRMVVNIRLY